MKTEDVIMLGQQALELALVLSGPPILAALVVGLLIAIFQAATQLNESTISLAPKIVIVYAVIALSALAAVRQLSGFARELFASIGG